jgi:hypothetical protein
MYYEDGPATEKRPGIYDRTVHREWSFNEDGDGEPPFVELRRILYPEIAARLRGRPPVIVRSARPVRTPRGRGRVARRRRTRSSSRAGPDREPDPEPRRPSRRGRA